MMTKKEKFNILKPSKGKQLLRWLNVLILNPYSLLLITPETLLRLFCSRKLKYFRGRLSNLVLNAHKGIYRVYSGTLVLSRLPRGIKLLHPVGIFAIEDVYIHEVYDLPFKPLKGFTVVDVGASVGDYTVKLASEVGENGLVIAIEPNPVNYRFLKYNVKKQKLKNVIPLRIAIMEYNGEVKISLAGGSSSTVTHANEGIGVPCRTLDNVMDGLGIKRIDLVKIDVEGAELNVLKGIRSTSVERFAIAAYHATEEVKEIAESLSLKGYKVTAINGFVYAISHSKNPKSK